MTRFHLIWDQTERLFSRGQRFMRQRRFAEALTCFELASSVDPQYPQIHLYRGLALSEMGRYEDAAAACGEAIKLDPSNPALSMFLAVIHLDHQHPQIALDHLDQAVMVEPKNYVVMGYRLLAKYDMKDDAALADLQRILHHLSDGVGSRLAQRLEERFPDKADEELEIEPSPPISLIDLLPRSLKPWAEQRRNARTKRKLEQAERMVSAGTYRKALHLLKSLPPCTSEDWPAFERLKEAAFEGIWDDERKILRDLERGRPPVPSADRLTRGRRRHEKLRRQLLRELALSLMEGGKLDESYKVSVKWWSSYSACGKPMSEGETAIRVLKELAAIDYDRQDCAKVIEFCEEAKKLGCRVSIDLMEARAELALGQKSAARWLLEEYLNEDLHYLERRLQNAIADLTQA